MLKAKKSALFEKVFAVYNRNLFKRRFHSFKISGLDNLQPGKRPLPLIIYANHSSWWDGLVAFEISRAARLDAFVMMEEKQLERFFLFRRLGAFSVARESPRAALKSLNYSANLLKESPNRTLWIFPQGEILPNDSRPLKFYNGVSRIIEKLEKCLVVAAAIRYEFLGEFKPEIFVKIEAPELFSFKENFNSKSFTKNLEKNLTLSLDELKNEVLTKQTDNYKRII